MNKTMLLGAVLLLAGGCSTTPYLNNQMGESVRVASQAQADMSKPADPSTEAPVDGQISNAAMDRYHNSYGKPETTTNVFNIGVGTK